MTLIKHKQEPKPNRNYPDYFYRNDDMDVADLRIGKVAQFCLALFLVVIILGIVYWTCK